jgi:uncharacterized membrane protein YczE
VIPLHEKYGVGTLCNVVRIGLVIDVVLPLLPDDASIGVRVAMLVVGAFLFARARVSTSVCSSGLVLATAS